MRNGNNEFIFTLTFAFWLFLHFAVKFDNVCFFVTLIESFARQWRWIGIHSMNVTMIMIASKRRRWMQLWRRQARLRMRQVNETCAMDRFELSPLTLWPLWTTILPHGISSNSLIYWLRHDAVISFFPVFLASCSRPSNFQLSFWIQTKQ
jgi:hypothetical protein